MLCLSDWLRCTAQETAQGELKESSEKMLVSQAQRDRLLQLFAAAAPEAAAAAREAVEAMAAGTPCEGDTVRDHLERIAELEREVKRLKQVSRYR